ncbi:hypothetical protein FGIG_07304, partial [Fasciola gigantica]
LIRIFTASPKYSAALLNISFERDIKEANRKYTLTSRLLLRSTYFPLVLFRQRSTPLDVIRLCFELLRDICHEHARLLRRDSNTRSTSSCNRDPSEAHTHARPTNTDVGAAYSGADPKHLIVARLNVLVLISKRVFLRLDEQHDLLQPVLGAIYRV